MKYYYKLIILYICILLFISGCKSNNSNNRQIESETNSPTTSFIPSSTVEDGSIDEPWETKGLFTPIKAKTTTIETYKICEGTDVENEITILTAKKEGPTIFIIAGQHADEIAGYMAVNELKDMELARGKVYILSPANMPGYNAEAKKRYVYGEEDLNRSYPGKTDGTNTELLAYSIYSEIERIKPDLVLDHHEARNIKTDKDFLGSSFIYTDLDGMEDLFINMYQETQKGQLCAGPFNFFSPGPIGSLNNTVTTKLSIPVITVETYRGYVLERRIEEHIAVVGYVLNHYGMLDIY